jgi:tetratricopeptide (TPR) repeat protein
MTTLSTKFVVAHTSRLVYSSVLEAAKRSKLQIEVDSENLISVRQGITPGSWPLILHIVLHDQGSGTEVNTTCTTFGAGPIVRKRAKKFVDKFIEQLNHHCSTKVQQEQIDLNKAETDFDAPQTEEHLTSSRERIAQHARHALFSQAMKMAAEWENPQATDNVARPLTQDQINYWLEIKDLLQPTLGIEPFDPHAQYFTGIALLWLNRWPESEGFLREAVRQSPSEADYAGALGRVLMKQWKLVESEEWFRRAIKLGNENERLYMEERNVLTGYEPWRSKWFEQLQSQGLIAPGDIGWHEDYFPTIGK